MPEKYSIMSGQTTIQHYHQTGGEFRNQDVKMGTLGENILRGEMK